MDARKVPTPPKPDTREWLAKRFDLKIDDVLWYHGGTCYDRIVVSSKAAADKVSAAVQGECVNGGWFHGMPLGGQTKTELEDGSEAWDVMC